MPLYEYLCTKCHARFEKIEKHSAPNKQRCPRCGGKAERQLSASGFQFKGSGWYVTDYARSGAAGAKKEEGSSTDSKEMKAAKEATDTKDSKETKKEPKKEKKQK